MDQGLPLVDKVCIDYSYCSKFLNSFLGLFSNKIFMPTQQSNAQLLVNFLKKRTALGRESKIEECHAIAYGFLQL